LFFYDFFGLFALILGPWYLIYRKIPKKESFHNFFYFLGHLNDNFLMIFIKKTF